jgi:hypothetical protein
VEDYIATPRVEPNDFLSPASPLLANSNA